MKIIISENDLVNLIFDELMSKGIKCSDIDGVEFLGKEGENIDYLVVEARIKEKK